MTPTQIGRYIVIAEIGRGRMGIVYAARDPQLEGREVAIKILPAELLVDPVYRTRFEQEARWYSQLEHNAIVPVYEIGETDGQPYIVMRLMSGGSLAGRLEQGPMILEECSRVVSRIAPALDLAHAKGIIHRDIKPANILFDKYNEPYLADFGIAKFTTSGVTLTGSAFIGTPAYASPEQVHSEEDLDATSDIYSLGATLFHMLTGRVPYIADDIVSQMLMHINEDPPDVLSFRPDLPVECQHIIQRAMAKRKFTRYKTAGDMAAELADLARKHPTPKRLRRETIAMTTPPKGIEKTNLMPQGVSGGSGSTVSDPTTEILPPAWGLGRQWLRRAGILLVVAVLVVLGAFLLSKIPSLAGSQLSGSANGQSEASPTELLDAPTLTPTPTFKATETSTPTPLLPQALPPTATPSITPTPEPTSTGTPTPTPSGPVIGGADKIGFVRENEVWIADLDGTNLVQLTQSYASKYNLQWTPDGEALTYISGPCVWLISIYNEYSTAPEGDSVLCVDWTDLRAFEISPDGERVALSLGDGLYILPYDLTILGQIQHKPQMDRVEKCLLSSSTNPKAVRWSGDSQSLAAVIVGSDVGLGMQLDLVVAMDVSQCGQEPVILHNVAVPELDLYHYSLNPIIESFAWNGGSLYLINTDKKFGFGDFVEYNASSRGGEILHPFANQCCFRDFRWSPDGKYLIFAFEDIDRIEQVLLYYVPYHLIREGIDFPPLPFGENFFKHGEHPQPVLRPAP